LIIWQWLTFLGHPVEGSLLCVHSCSGGVPETGKRVSLEHTVRDLRLPATERHVVQGRLAIGAEWRHLRPCDVTRGGCGQRSAAFQDGESPWQRRVYTRRH